MTRRFFLSAATLLCFFSAVRASAAASDRDDAFRNATSTWTSLSASLAGSSVVIVEIAQPQPRKTCHVRDLLPDGLVCSKHFHRDVTIPVRNIAAVVESRNHDDCTLAIWGATGLGFLAAGFFAGPGAPAVWVVGGLVLITWPAAAIGADNGLEHDAVLYFTPDSRPTLPLQ